MGVNNTSSKLRIRVRTQENFADTCVSLPVLDLESSKYFVMNYRVGYIIISDVADHFFRIHQFLHIRPPLSMARNIPFLAGLGLASVIGCYVIFPKPVVAVYSKLSGKEMSKPEKWSQRASLVAKQVTNPVAEVQFYRNIGLFGAAVYLIATQGHQMTVA